MKRGTRTEKTSQRKRPQRGGDSEAEGRADASTAAQKPREAPPRQGRRVPGGRSGAGAGGEPPPSHLGRAGGAATVTGAGQAPRGEPPPSHQRQGQPLGTVWGNLPLRLRHQEVISRGKGLHRQGLGPLLQSPAAIFSWLLGISESRLGFRGFQPPGGTSPRDKGPGAVIISSTTDTPPTPTPRGKIKSKQMPGGAVLSGVGRGDTEI